MQRTYIAIDLKSFYASAECAERHLDPLTTNLVVADLSRTEKTICLAVSPSLKAWGISGRARLFEVVQRVRDINRDRLHQAIRGGCAVKSAETESGWDFASASFDDTALRADPSLRLDYIVATPRMSMYMDYSTRIYQIYLKYIAPEDIHVYSIDECFMDVTDYLRFYDMTARQLAMMMIRDVLYTTGITATGGIGTNLYLCKVAMDIVAKHVPPDKDGVRLAELDERSYREQLWDHQPLTDFWRVGGGIARKLEKHQIYTMGDIARCSLGRPGEPFGEDLLYRLFGVNAELLIDHAWGWEPCTMKEIHQYRPEGNSLSSGQVLHCPYDADKARLIVKEMTDQLVLDLVRKGLVTDQLALYVGYDADNLRAGGYSGAVVFDHYGRSMPKYAHGTVRLERRTSSSRVIMEQMLALYDNAVDPMLMIRRVNVVAARVFAETEPQPEDACEQLSFLTDYAAREAEEREREEARQQERALQQTMLSIKERFGKNAILKGMNLEEGGTMIERNRQVGGHKA